MGNENDKNKDKYKNDYFSFEIIRDSLNITAPKLFKKYLHEIFVDLANKNEKNIKYISRMTFYDYTKLPILISQKLFFSFAKTSKTYLLEDEFIDGFLKLYMGTFEETAEIIFNLLDFDKDGIIKKEDVKIMMSYLPLNHSDKKLSSSEGYIFQMESLNEIDEIIHKTFKKYEGKMNFEQFIDTVKNNKSDVYLQIILFLYQQKPFTNKNIEPLKIKYGLTDEEYNALTISYKESRKDTELKIRSPNRKTSLSPINRFITQHMNQKALSFNENETKEHNFNLCIKKNSSGNLDEMNKKSQSNKGLVIRSLSESASIDKNKHDKETSNSQDKEEEQDYFELDDEKDDDIVLNIEEDNDDIKEKYSSLGFNDTANENRKKSEEHDLGVTENEFIKEMKFNENIIEQELIMNNNLEKNIIYENYVYKITDSGLLKKIYLVLINKDIYYYKTDKKDVFLGMHNLSGCFIHENTETEVMKSEEKVYYSFEIFFKNKNKTRQYYSEDKEIIKEFASTLKKSTGFLKFTDYYEIRQIIGKGKFGVVNLGINRKTGAQVAVKIINKSILKTIEDHELIRIEVGILKLCRHPNIIRLFDFYENDEHIYIITEYVEGGNLTQYLKKEKFNFTEEQAANMIYQIGSGVKYLHQFGIVHRDLKPDNILITQQNDYGTLKINDFGLSRIVSSQEKMYDGYGTLSYVAPEVLIRNPYNKEVDLWSMGVILYYILSSQLPFKGPKEAIIAEKIVYDPLLFDKNEWENRSKRVQDLIYHCLKKHPEERIKIDEFLNHPWLKKRLKQKLSM